MTAEAGPLPAAVPVADLVIHARDGDQGAWDAIIERYALLVWSICRRYRLADADADNVGQAVWLLLINDIGQIRDPAELPGWLAATTARECGRFVRAARRTCPSGQIADAGDIPDEQVEQPGDDLLPDERHAALHEALADLPPPCQRLIALLTHDPPLPYAQISARLGIPVDSIEPSRRRCLAELRCHPAIADLANADPASVTDRPPGPAKSGAPA